MKRINRRLLTEVFKREAIKLVTDQHLNIKAAGRQFARCLTHLIKYA